MKFLVFSLDKLVNWAEQDKNRYLYIAGAVNILAVLALVYIVFFNTYRIDYVSGNILVDPYKSIYVAFVVYGYILGLLNGCFLCRITPSVGAIRRSAARAAGSVPARKDSKSTIRRSMIAS